MFKIISSIKSKPRYIILMSLALALYFLNNLYLKSHSNGILHRFLVSHFNDLICPFFILSYSNILLLCVGREIIRLRHIVAFCLSASFIWEFGAPLMKKASVTDGYDIISYVLGGIVYWGLNQLLDRFGHE